MKETLPVMVISKEMIENAKQILNSVDIKRTKASKIDTLAGILGEFVFAEYFFGNWKLNSVGRNKGQTDFENIEIKVSAFPFNENLNLLVREDYAKKTQILCLDYYFCRR